MYISTTIYSECGTYELHAFHCDEGYKNPIFGFDDTTWDNGEWLYKKMWKKLKKGKHIKGLPDEILPELLEMFIAGMRLGFFREFIDEDRDITYPITADFLNELLDVVKEYEIRNS